MRKILVIGAGGIGSYLISYLNKLNLYNIQVNDDDKVETKNLTYQNFSDEDVGKHNVDCMKRHTSVKIASPYPILTPQQLEGFDLVVCCVDNLGTRRMLYNSNVKWLDLRSQGRNAAYVSLSNRCKVMKVGRLSFQERSEKVCHSHQENVKSWKVKKREFA